MEQSTTSRSKRESYLSTLFGSEEIEVADILLNLPTLIESEFPSQFNVIWGGKKRRSAIDLSPSREEEREKEKRPKVKVEASSPTTPFSFPPSESDEKSKLSLKKSSTKTTREERLEIIDELTQRRDMLQGEIEAVKSYYKQLKAINMDLKAKKKELEMCKKFGVELSIQSKKLENQDCYSMAHHQQPSNVDHTAYGPQAIEKFQQIFPYLSYGCGSGEAQKMGPLCIPDLNVSAEETLGVKSSQPLDWNRGVVAVADDDKARAAEARRRRMVKIKEMKGCFGSIKSVKCR